MRQKFWTLLVFAAFLFAVSELTPTMADGSRVLKTPDQKHVIVFTDGKPTNINLNDLVDGASKVIQSGKDTITVTRKGDSLLINVNGKDMPDLPSLPADGTEGHRRMVFVTSDGKAGDVLTSSNQVFVLKDVQSDGTTKTFQLESSSDKKEVVVHDGAQVITLKLSDLADGETRSFTIGKHTLTITRKGDSFVIQLDGKDLPVAHGSPLGPDQDMKFVFVPHDGEAGKQIKMQYVTIKTDDNGNASSVTVMASSDTQELTAKVDGQTFTYSIKDMAEGESRTFAAGTHTIVVTKASGDYHLSIDGKACPSPKLPQ